MRMQLLSLSLSLSLSKIASAIPLRACPTAMAYYPVCFPGEEEGESACFYCKRGPARLRSGWRLSSGGYAQLCDECASAYEDGTFCETYHSNADGWRNCNTCQKLLHCGCIMSAHAFVVLDFGGVSCMDCLRNDFTQNGPEAQQILDESQAAGLSDGSVEMTAEIQYEVYLSATHAPAVLHATLGETAFQNVISTVPYNESPPLTDYGVTISQNSYHGAEFKSPERFPLHDQCLANETEKELQKTSEKHASVCFH
ncbi:uncharacterized protein LOC104448400 isoform X1 [Eucalyptus grandis]|uniref:uncharacterized protein LOC104448400 isoform X1 n=1 Tax=Eucalyptus grandis TaxID=71139 RepID=UPI00192ED978|nr:uncharacterized protein LOC104448400 isoform X1 [Eucalyptus grandis]